MVCLNGLRLYWPVTAAETFFACFLVHRQHEKSLNQPRAEEGLGGHSTSWRGHATSQAAKAEAQTKLKPFRIWIGIWMNNPNPVVLGCFHQNFGGGTPKTPKKKRHFHGSYYCQVRSLSEQSTFVQIKNTPNSPNSRELYLPSTTTPSPFYRQQFFQVENFVGRCGNANVH